MDPRCDIAVSDAVATYYCDNRIDSVRHVAAHTLKKVWTNDWVAQNGRMSTNCLHDYMLACRAILCRGAKAFLRPRGHPRAIQNMGQSVFEAWAIYKPILLTAISLTCAHAYMHMRR